MDRRAGLIAAATAVVLAALAFIAIGAVATPNHFLRCVAYPLGNFKDDRCTEPVLSGSYKRIAITEGTAAAYSGTQTSNQVLVSTVSGTKVTITCTTAATSGKTENPSGGGAGVVRETVIKLGECTVAPAELKCQVAGKAITTSKLSGTTTTGPAIKMGPESAGPIAKVVIEKCLFSSFNGTYELNGTMVGTFDNSASTIEFTSTSGSSLTLNGQSATFTGSDEFTSEGQTLFVE
jgi:hypothetical protein